MLATCLAWRLGTIAFYFLQKLVWHIELVSGANLAAHIPRKENIGFGTSWL
jgi:hypothetical protein